jgi:GNAT superfamily N-acetyltransferase
VDGIRLLTSQDINQALELSVAEGWNQTEKDWELLVRNPGNICLAVEAEGKVIATATAMNYDNEIAWIGMVLVDREHRGQGLSKILLTVLLERLKFFRSVKLDATAAGESVYKKSGFRTEHRIFRMIAKNAAIKFQTDENFFEHLADKDDIPGIIESDKIVFGAGRENLITHLISEYPETAFVLKKQGEITGFALGRSGCRFYQVGPVVAGNTDDAIKLITMCISRIGGKPVVIDIPEDKKALIAWLHAAGFTEQRSFMRMYLHENPFPGIPEQQFLIGGPEFG